MPKIYRITPETEEEFDYYDSFDYGFLTWQERFQNWKNWKQTSEGKRATKKRNRIWLKQLQ